MSVLDPICMCGHTEDEHDILGNCEVPDCDCVAFEDDEEPDAGSN